MKTTLLAIALISFTHGAVSDITAIKELRNVASTRATTTKREEHGEVACADLDVCTKYARCAELIYPEKSDCLGSCSQCIDTEVYGSCENYRNEQSSKVDYTIQCYGDTNLLQVPRCNSDMCRGYTTAGECLNVNHCVWVEEGDQCIGDHCGRCAYSPLSCDLQKQCYDDTTSLKTRVHRCDLADVQYGSCSNLDSSSSSSDSAEPSTDCARCTDMTYSRCVGTTGCAWVDMTDYYADKGCAAGCGYCEATCRYGGNNTCAQAKAYEECRKGYTSTTTDTSPYGDGSTVSSGSSSDDEKYTTDARKIVCAGDPEPADSGRCDLRKFMVDNTRQCEDLTYDECMDAIATNTSGGCSYLVTNNCGRSCGRCVSLGIPCSSYKVCHDSSNTDGSESQTYYCTTEEVPSSSKVRCGEYCTGTDPESCLAGDRCMWHQYKSLDYRCGWCGGACDSCAKEQKRVASAYNNDKFFNGGQYDIICDTTDKKLLKSECRKCYGKKSECANAFCLEELQACNLDETCSERAFKVMCTEFGEDEGTVFFEKMAKEEKTEETEETEEETEEESTGSSEDGVTENEALLNLAECMRQSCFDSTDDDDVNEEYNGQTTGEAACSFGYAEVTYAVTICMEGTSISDLCRPNYAKRFEDILTVDDAATVYWRYLDDTCKVFDKKARRLLQDGEDESATTNIDPADSPWSRITGTTETPEEIAVSENCLPIEIVVTYPTQESYQMDKEEYSYGVSLDELMPGATVTIDSWNVECCIEDEVCQNMEGSSVAVSTLLAAIAAFATLLFI